MDEQNKDIDNINSESKETGLAVPPEEFTGIHLNQPKKNSVGFPAIASAIGHAFRYMSPGPAVKTMFKVNQKGGFDCPGCAWPDPDDDRSPFGEYCENGMKAIAEEASSKSIDRFFFEKNSVRKMSEWSDFEIGKKGRLKEPMVIFEDETHYSPISWNEAFNLISEELNGLDTPNEAVFYTSGRTSNEAAFLYQLFAREFGTNNLPDCSNMCHESSGQGLSQTVGIGKGSVTLEDLHKSELILVVGQNPGTNHPRMLSALEKCKENGGQVVSINPLPEAGLIKFTNPQRPLKMISGGTELSDLYLPIRINQDISLFKALMALMWEAECKAPGTVFDHEFIQEYTSGYDELLEDIKSYDYDSLLQDTGLEDELVRKLAQLIIEKKKIIICWAMGLTQHENGVDNIKEVVNILLLKGSIGKEGAGTCPVRGHSNVQGDRTMGIWEAPKPAFLDKLDEVFGIQSPRDHGYPVVDAINAMHEGKAKVFFAMGGNFISATPDTEYTAEALRKTNLTVHVSTKLNRSHLIHGKTGLILPCLGRTEKDVQINGEQFVTVENSMGVVHSSKGVLKPVSYDLLSEPAIVGNLAKMTLAGRTKIDWQGMVDNYDLIRDAIEKVIPGFEDYNERVRKPGGFYLPNGARDRKFNTASGKANFSVLPNRPWTLGEKEFLMMTIRSHDQYNTTIYGLDDRYRGIINERRVVLISEKDLRKMDFKAGDIVDIKSVFNGKERFANKFMLVTYPIPEGCIATYFPEANTLVPIDQFAKGSKTPASKSVLVTLHKKN